MKAERGRILLIVVLLALAIGVGALNVFGRSFVVQQLGWAESSLPLFLVSVSLSLWAGWNMIVIVTRDRRDRRTKRPLSEQ